jgi:hypothetical protein
MDEESLDEVHCENEDLDRWKNQFLNAKFGEIGRPPPSDAKIAQEIVSVAF